MLTTHILTSPVVFLSTRQPPIDDDVRRHVDALWDRAVLERPHLFDGPVSYVVEVRQNTLAVAATTYRYVIAARQDPALATSLKIRPLAVSGILSCRDGFVLGRRSAVAHGSGLFELVPSGGVTPRQDGAMPNLEEEILRELQEEIGLRDDQVRTHAAIGLLDDDHSGTIDIIVPICALFSADEISAIHQNVGSDEYDCLQFYKPNSHSDHLPSALLPETRVIIETFLPKLSSHLLPWRL